MSKEIYRVRSKDTIDWKIYCGLRELKREVDRESLRGL